MNVIPDRELDRDLRIRAMRLFIDAHVHNGDKGLAALAEFIVYLNESVDGLSQNNRALAAAYREAVEHEELSNVAHHPHGQRV